MNQNNTPTINSDTKVMSERKSKQKNLYADLLTPISDDQPCGSNLEYDPEFLLLFAKATERPEAQYGDFVNTPESVNWNEVERDAKRLLLRTKDIRIFTLLLRSRIQLAGATGLQEGLTLLEKACASFTRDIHPQMEGDEETPAEEAALVRANALAALVDPVGVMSDIRSIVLSNSAAMRLQVRDVERALSIPRPADALAPESVRRQLADLRQRGHQALPAFDESMSSLEKLQAWADDTLKDATPDLSPLRKLIKYVQEQESRAPAKRETPEETPQPEPVNTEETSSENQDQEQSVLQEILPVGITDRFDALARIENIRNWFETHEPSSPAIPLLRQAERMVGKRFSEVVNAIPIELLLKWDAVEEE